MEGKAETAQPFQAAEQDHLNNDQSPADTRRQVTSDVGKPYPIIWTNLWSGLSITDGGCPTITGTDNLPLSWDVFLGLHMPDFNN